MKKNILSLFNVLGKWKRAYLLAFSLIVVSIFIRMLEPKVFQVAIDRVLLLMGEIQEAGEADPLAGTLTNILDSVSVESVSGLFMVLGLVYLIIALFRGLGAFAASAVAASACENATQSLRNRIFDHIQRLPMSWHSSNPKGTTIQRCTGDISTVNRFLLNDMVEMFRLTIVFIAAFTMMWLVDWQYALIAVALVPVITAGSIYFFKREAKLWLTHEDEQDKLTNIVEENLSGIRVVKAFAREKDQIKKFNDQNLRKRKIGQKQVMLHAWYWPMSDFVLYLQFAISVVVGGYFTLQGRITVGELVSFYTYAWMVTWPLRQVGRVMSRMGMAAVAMERINTILDHPLEDYSGEEIGEKRMNGKIEFRNVSFEYEDGKKVLDNVNLVIEPGETVALIGATGAGKSTMMALLNRFYEPSQGSILIDGVDIATIDKRDLRERIGVVLQKAFLFSTSIKNNIAYTSDASNDEVMHAARMASIDEIIDVFSDGYETMVGEKGITLSGGQKQRVALARTLLSDPDLLVLDDSTSAVDTETEFRIQHELEKFIGNRTTIIIAHRVTSIQAADRVVVLDKGKIADQGSPAELLKRPGYFKEILEIQTALESDIKKAISHVQAG